jgi:transcriptional regulator with XRE-family HTH domain
VRCHYLKKERPRKTFDQWRLEAGLTVKELAVLAGVDRRTATKVKTNRPLQDVKAVLLIKSIGKKLKRDLTLEDIEDLKLS